MKSTSKKQADAYDKMLDIANRLFEFFESKEIAMDEDQLEELTIFLAENKDQVISIFKTYGLHLIR